MFYFLMSKCGIFIYLFLKVYQSLTPASSAVEAVLLYSHIRHQIHSTLFIYQFHCFPLNGFILASYLSPRCGELSYLE